MEFMSQTSITDSNFHCDNMFLELKDFDNIKNGSHDTSFLIDVIGEVLDFGGLDIVQCARKEVTKMEFTLRDINDNRLQCCIAGKIAEIMTQENKQPNNGDICLIRYAKLGNYKGELQVSNAFDSSLVLLNSDIKEAQALKNMQAKHDKVLIQEKRQKWSQFPFKTIQEMKRTDKDQTGETKITLLNSVAKSIVKTSAAKVVNVLLDEVQDQEMFPPEIVEIIGTTYGFGISVDGVEKFSTMKV
ncbi:hypothetical protein DY000_02006883 [Brassica cretica]|uniref:Replication factor-A protein 1 N-terminal domain-containing protein n=1 Tax=Brassica cretica TaxID=69181 RepID=A0ABQ7BVA3_BRACR|nr:hypothetical protein DY000_02006883 [Brassica cretica]